MVSIHDMQVGIIVDMVSDVVGLTGQGLVALPASKHNNAHKYLKSVLQMSDRLILTINCEEFFQDDLKPVLF